MTTWTRQKVSALVTKKKDSYGPVLTEHFPYLGLEYIEQQSLRLSGIGDSAETDSQKKKGSSS